MWWCSICIVCMSAPIQTHQDHVRDQEQLARNHVKVTSGRSFQQIHSITSATLPDRIPVWFYNIRQVENQQYHIFYVFICSVLIIQVYFECYVLLYCDISVILLDCFYYLHILHIMKYSDGKASSSLFHIQNPIEFKCLVP